MAPGGFYLLCTGFQYNLIEEIGPQMVHAKLFLSKAKNLESLENLTINDIIFLPFLPFLFSFKGHQDYIHGVCLSALCIKVN